MHRSPEYLGRHRLAVMNNHTYQVVSPSGKRHFESPATLKGVIKIYLLGTRDVLHYIGITGQPMARRLNYGPKADGKNGYHGYPWKTEFGEFDLDIWQFSRSNSDSSIHFAEAVEAEIAFLYKMHSGEWPTSQTEIHFSNKFDMANPVPRDIAERILDQFKRDDS